MSQQIIGDDSREPTVDELVEMLLTPEVSASDYMHRQPQVTETVAVPNSEIVAQVVGQYFWTHFLILINFNFIWIEKRFALFCTHFVFYAFIHYLHKTFVSFLKY